MPTMDIVSKPPLHEVANALDGLSADAPALSSEDLAVAWRPELDRRREELERGEVETVDARKALAGIRARFETVLTRDDVTRGKPSPDLFFMAAARLGMKPEFCLAVEDSNPGVAAAHAAGAITIMVPDIVPPTAESRAKCAAVLPDLNALLAALQEQGTLGRRSDRPPVG